MNCQSETERETNNTRTMLSSVKRIILILSINVLIVSCDKNDDTPLPLGDQLVIKFTGYIDNFTKYLEGYNDANLGKSDLGRFLGYEDMKPKLDGGREGKSIKKMSTAMLPLIFHVGATSTWMLLTSIMAAKSVAIGLALLVFKIAVSSAKVASFFTTLKAKHSSHHHDWNWSPPEYGTYPNKDWQTYNPEWTPNDVSPPEYKTIPIYENVDRDATPYGSIASKKNDKQFSRK